MLKIRDIRETDRAEFFEMSKDFYGGPACDHNVPEAHFEATLQEILQNPDAGR